MTKWSWASTVAVSSDCSGYDGTSRPVPRLWCSDRTPAQREVRRPGGVSELRGPRSSGRGECWPLGRDPRLSSELSELRKTADPPRTREVGGHGRVLRPQLPPDVRVRGVCCRGRVGGPCGVIAGSLSV